jgi:uncharacterized membrane protein (DUF106 family)
MDALETQLLIEKTKVKSPGFAAILSFFFPALGAFYTGKILAGLFYLVVDFFNLILVIIGIGIITGLLFRLIAAFLAYSWAREINQKALEALVVSRRQQVTA